MPTDFYPLPGEIQWTEAELNSMSETTLQTATAIQAGIKKKRPDPFGQVKEPQKEEEMTPIVPLPGFKFGCDPELFVKNEAGVHVSAAGLIPGDKASPHRVELGAVQVDGMAAEFNIDPVDNFADWDKNIRTVLKQLQAMLPKGYALDATPSVTFSDEEMAKVDEEAKQLGCSPDFDAWTGGVNCPPNPDLCQYGPNFRTAAGHIHISWTEGMSLSDLQHVINCRDVVKQLDWYLGAWSLKMDLDERRRVMYGKAGACRYKTYGVEYRVLSNFWITTRERRLAVWNRMQQALHDINQKFIPDRAPPGYNDAMILAINVSKRNKGIESKYRYPIQTIDQNYAYYS
jgi:hypothetical protein